MRKSIIFFIHYFFSFDNFISNFILKKIALQRRFLYKRKNYSNLPKIEAEDLNISGDKFKFVSEIEDLKKLKEMNSVAGYIPFKKSTSIILYNFFSKNYALRKQLLGKISYIKDEKIVDIFWFLLPVNAVVSIEDEHKDIDADFVVVELFHKKIKKNHGGVDGHYRFWGSYENNSAIVHSMPINSFYLKKKYYELSSRRFFPQSVMDKKKSYNLSLISSKMLKKEINLTENKIYGDYSSKTLNNLGYNLISEKNSEEKENIVAVWHDASVRSKTKESFYQRQIISIPPIDNINAIIYFTEALKGNADATIYFYNLSNEIIFEKKVNITPKYELNLKNLIDKPLMECKYIKFDFGTENYIYGYLNIIYLINNKLCDNVHSHYDFGIHKKGPQALKFMYFPEQENFNSYMAISGMKYSMDIKLRLILKNDLEYVFNFNLLKSDITFFTIKDLLNKVNENIKIPGVIQFESKYGNPDADLFTYNNKNQTLSVDHFTGG
jgi:hypothetical protein